MLNIEASSRRMTGLSRPLMRHARLALLVFNAWSAPAFAESVKVAIVGPASGPMATRTLAVMEGARSAATAAPARTLDSAEAPSADSVAIDIAMKDDGCDATKAEAVAKEIVAQGFDLVVGHPCEKTALAAAKIYGAAGTTFIATQTRHRDLTAKRAGASIFRLSPREDAQGREAARLLARFEGKAPVAVVHDRTRYALTIAEQAVAELKAHKIEPTLATIIAGEKDYPRLIAKIKDARAVFFAGFPLEAGLILKGLRAAGSSAHFLATETVATDEFPATFADLAPQAFVLRAVGPDTGDDQRRAATRAVRLYVNARARAFGPVKPAEGWKALINATLARIPVTSAETSDDAQAAQTGTASPPCCGREDASDAHRQRLLFDENGNADEPSFIVVRWRGASWATTPDGLR